MNIRDWITEKMVLPAYDRLRGDRSRDYEQEVREFNKLEYSEIRSRQLGRLRMICDYAYSHSPFYRNRFAAVGLNSFSEMTFDDFAKIPPLTKDDVRENLEGLLSNVFDRACLKKTATGGTTSAPATFFLDWDAYFRRWGCTNVFDEWMSRSRGRKTALLWGARQDLPDGSWRSKLRNSLTSRNLFLSATPLDDSILEAYYLSLKRFRPHHLQAYPSALRLFADYLVRNDLVLNIPSISVTAEPVPQGSEAVFEIAFGVRPFNWYGARELGRIATECKFHTGMHINAYQLYVETIKEGQGCVLSDLLVTDLWNSAMPLIRYQIQDVGGIVHEVCQCGSHLPRITSIAGRTADHFVNTKGQLIPGVSFVNRILTENSEVTAIQIVQRQVDEFEFRIVPGPNWKGRVSERKLVDKLSMFLNDFPRTHFELVHSIPRESSGKVRICKNEIPLSDRQKGR